jgi:hypothetical protein
VKTTFGTRTPSARLVAIVIFLATVGRLVVATFATGLPQFSGKGFGARLVAYPLMMLIVPALGPCAAAWATRQRPSHGLASP